MKKHYLKHMIAIIIYITPSLTYKGDIQVLHIVENLSCIKQFLVQKYIEKCFVFHTNSLIKLEVNEFSTIFTCKINLTSHFLYNPHV